MSDRHKMLTSNCINSSKQRSQFYEEQFQYKDDVSGHIRERVSRESPVVAELRTNVIIKDEFTLVRDLSHHLALRYTRPDSVIMVKVDHSACLALGGTFEPCYILTITAVSSQMSLSMNKRNAALIQSFMADIIGVSSECGVVKFCAIAQEDLAINGTTVLGEMERQEKQNVSGTGSAMRRMISSSKKSIPSFKKSMQRSNGDAQPNLDDRLSREEESSSLNSQFSNTVVRRLHSRNRHKRKGSASTRPATANAALQHVIFELPAGDVVRSETSATNGNIALGGSDLPHMNSIPDAAAMPDASVSNGNNEQKQESIDDSSQPLRHRALDGDGTAINPTTRAEGSANPQAHDKISSDNQKSEPAKAPSIGGEVERLSQLQTEAVCAPDDRDTANVGSHQPTTSSQEATSAPNQLGTPSQGKATASISVREKAKVEHIQHRPTLQLSVPPRLDAPPISDTSDTTDAKSTKSSSMRKRKGILLTFRKSAVRSSTS